MLRRGRMIASGSIIDSVRRLTVDLSVLAVTLEIVDLAVQLPEYFPVIRKAGLLPPPRLPRGRRR
jgi:hypothetical protein